MIVPLDSYNQFTCSLPILTDNRELKLAELKIDTGANISVIGEQLLGLSSKSYDVGGTFVGPGGKVVKTRRVYGYTLLVDNLGICNLSFDVNPIWTAAGYGGNKLLLGMDILRYFGIIYDENTQLLTLSPNSKWLDIYIPSSGNILDELLAF